MLRALFEKTGQAVWMSHLDLMRVFQRAFKRAGLTLTHTQGYNPRPSVSIALPLSVGVASHCELLDFELEGQSLSCDEIQTRLNQALVDGVRVLQVYETGDKLKNLALLDCEVVLEYDAGIPANAEDAITALFARENLLVDKRSKNGTVEQDIIPLIRKLTVTAQDQTCLVLQARICCQNPTLNPVQLSSAIAKYLPEYASDFVSCRRMEIYKQDETIFR